MRAPLAPGRAGDARPRRWRATVCLAGMLVSVVSATAVWAFEATATAIVPSARPAACATRKPARIGPNAWAPTQRALAPAGASAIRLCRYSGLQVRPRLALVGSALRTGPGVVARLAGELDRLPSQPPGPVNCPSDDGSEIVALLAYPTGRAVAISVGLTGCAAVTNGNLRETAFGFGQPRRFGRRLLAELARLTGCRGTVS